MNLTSLILSDCREMKRKRFASSSSRVYGEECIFCGKEKYVRGTNSREKLVKATQLRVDQTLREKAISKCDENILAITSRDIVAAEAHYHRSCYRDYTRPEKIQDDQAAGINQQELVPEQEAFFDLFQYIRAEVIEKQLVVSMTELTRKLESFYQSREVDELSELTKKHMRRKIEAEFGSALDSFADDKGKLLIISENLSRQETVKANILLKQELEILKSKSTDSQKVIDQCATYIRHSIFDIKWQTPWPIHPSDLNAESFPVPENLSRFLMGLLTSYPGINSPSERVKTLVNSFSQDIIYATTCGQTQPPKQILLSYGVKTMTGNVELIQMLNRFGHAVSYSQIEENDTALCLQKMASSLNQTTILPGTIRPNVFTNLAWDNIDRLEETLTGEGTTHRVNGIAVQPRVYGPHLPSVAPPAIEKRKQRVITHEVQPLNTYISGERVGPQPLTTTDTDDNDQQNEAEKAGLKNMIWLLAQEIGCHNQLQKIPSWTGFNILARRGHDIVSKDVVGYLSTINAPATQLTTVNEILRQSDGIRKALNLDEIVVVMDQALYAKASEVIWQHPDQYSAILLRLGTFYTMCNLLSIIGKRHQDAGLRDLCIESGIIAEGSVSGVLEGKMYNRAVRVHKCVYEALMRLVWQQFSPWVASNHPDKLPNLCEVKAHVSEMVGNFSQEQYGQVLHSQAVVEVHELWSQFL